ncbi:PREDICTED: tripartite motif-containing protein 2-like [Branchiostoma belcheri]|uniref:RING-type E3 ubiquitin transferase n=1 Tax=Branchiostoma belcheri TaxID=7741 RepID=A0A6P4YHS0_BRABE|nr:PREDICTED: tripartite motif-containing protein 2-like [Branchiostoma belcheri]
MASKFPAREDLDDQFLTCAICMLHYRDPKILPCLHSFCRECLQLWATKQQPLECPTCREPVRLPDQGVDGLRTNFYVNNLLDFAAAKKGAGPDHEVVSEETFMVEKDAGKFHRKRHCPKHNNHELVFYCESCKAFACTACTVVDHRPGKDHNPVEITTEAQKRKETLQGLLQNINPRLKEIQDAVKEVDRKISKLVPSKEAATDQAKAYFHKLADLLQKREEDILSQIDEQCRADGKALQAKKVAIEFELAGLTSAQTFCQQAVEHGSDVHVLEVGNQVQTRVETLLTKEGDLESNWSEFQFVENTTEVDNFGGVRTNVDVSKCKVAVKKPAVQGFQCVAELTTMNKEGHPCFNNSKAVITDMKDPSGTNLATQVQMKSRGLWEISYTPEVTGNHKLEVKVNSQQVSGSPFDVDVKGNPVLTITGEGSWVGELDRPVGVAVDKDGNIAVVERGNKRVRIFDKDRGHTFRIFPVEVEKAHSIDVDSEGRFLVTSRGENFGLRRYSKEGKLLNTLKPDCMRGPHGVTVLKDDRMVVADNKLKSCLLLQPDGTLIREIGKGQLQNPVFVSVDESRDVMFVTDKDAHKVFAFDLGGNLKFDFGKEGENDGEFRIPTGVTSDPAGNIIVGNSGDGRVQVFAPDGTFKQKLGPVKGECASGVALTPDGYIAVACRNGHCNCIELYRYM